MYRLTKHNLTLALLLAFNFLWHGMSFAEHPEGGGEVYENSESLPDLDELGDLEDNDMSLGESPLADTPELPEIDDLESAEIKSDLILLITGKVTQVNGSKAKVKLQSGYTPNVGEKIYFTQDQSENARVLIGEGVVEKVDKNELSASITMGSPEAGMTATVTSVNPVKSRDVETETPGTAAKIKPKKKPTPEMQLGSESKTPPRASIVPSGPDTNQSAESLYQTGKSYYNGEGVPRDYDKAFQWLQMAAGKGHPAAQNHLGIMYENGQGAVQNYQEAFNWYYKGAAQNNPAAHYNLGRLYDSGRGVRKNFSEAIKSFRRAAQLGQKNAQERLTKQKLRW